MDWQLIKAVLIAVIPIVWLLISLGWIKMPALKAGLIGLLITALIALLYINMPFPRIIQAVGEGVLLALWPILWAIVGAVYAYNVVVLTGNIEKIKAMLSGISGDPRIQVLILAWAFSGFLEGATGYGTAVAIPVSILIALGFDPVFSAVVCLIGNTAPTAFGAIGIPTITLAKLTEFDISTISSNVALQLTPFIVLLPLVIVYLTGKETGKGMSGVWGAALLAGTSFAVTHYLAARFIGPELPSMLGGMVSLTAIIVWTRLYSGTTGRGNSFKSQYTLKESFIAWSPYIILFVLVIFTSSLFPAINTWLASIESEVLIYRGAGGKPLVLHWVLTPGTLMFISAVIGGIIQGATLQQLMSTFSRTLGQLSKTIVTICSIVAIAKVMGYSGMVGTIATGVSALAGRLFPIFSPIIGAVGTFVTGSDTSSNVLFAQLQKQTALQLNLDPKWITAANTTGATAGKMISPQNIAIAATAAGLSGKEGDVFEKTFKICIVYVIIIGLMILVTS